jgi:hypothetical protein
MHMMSPITDDACAAAAALRHAMAQLLGAVNASFFSTIFV